MGKRVRVGTHPREPKPTVVGPSDGDKQAADESQYALAGIKLHVRRVRVIHIRVLAVYLSGRSPRLYYAEWRNRRCIALADRVRLHSIRGRTV